MDTNHKNILKSWPVLVVFLLLVLAITWVLTNKEINKTSRAPIIAESTDTHEQSSQPHTPYTLATIIKYRKTWDTTFNQWYGKDAPDLSFMDLEGKIHKLSDYKGKNVLVLFWATWCPPCRAEIPHLIELRKQKKPDELAIIAISDEDQGHVRQFASAKGLNYTVAGLTAAPTRPFSNVTSLPTSFYIDKEHKIKLAAVGAVSMGETMAIFDAKE